MSDAVVELVGAVREGLQTAADPAKAPRMQAYMKSTLPYYGVQSPAQKALFARVFAAHPLPGRSAWLAAVHRLWREATYREERYAAIGLAGYRAYAGYQRPDLVSGLYEELVTSGAWWDYVDDVAIHRIGPILRAEASAVEPEMRAWATDGNLWKRRSAIICQVGSKDVTDRDLLAYVIEANAPDRDFFIRKAIGWALREYAKRDPAWVRSFIAARSGSLAPLSKREALKNIG